MQPRRLGSRRQVKKQAVGSSGNVRLGITAQNSVLNMSLAAGSGSESSDDDRHAVPAMLTEDSWGSGSREESSSEAEDDAGLDVASRLSPEAETRHLDDQDAVEPGSEVAGLKQPRHRIDSSSRKSVVAEKVAIRFGADVDTTKQRPTPPRTRQASASKRAKPKKELQGASSTSGLVANAERKPRSRQSSRSSGKKKRRKEAPGDGEFFSEGAVHSDVHKDEKRTRQNSHGATPK